MTKSKFALLHFGLSILILVVHFILNVFYIQKLNSNALIELEAVVFILIIIGYTIMSPEIQRTDEKFVARFMITTTVQMLGLLSYVVYVFVSKYQHIKFFLIDLLVLFVAVLITQSLLLIRSRR